MANEYVSGAMFSDSLPQWQRTYYEALLLETLRTKSIMVPFCAVKEDFSARDTGRMTYTEVFDTDPNYNPLGEQDIWMRGAHLDSRSVTLDLEIHGDTLKFSDYSEIVQYVNKGNLRGLVKDKIGQNQIDTLDILARNAFLSHPNKVYAGGTRANRAAIVGTDIFDVDFAELARTHLEEGDIPGIAMTGDGDSQTIVCVTTPRVLHDIRANLAAGKWVEAQQYVGTNRLFTSEVGMWGGVRFIKSNRLVLPNAGAAAHQTTLSAATVPGQGAAATVDTVYSVGQSTSTRYITVADETGFTVGMNITIHDQALGTAVLESDGTQETRRIVSIDAATNKLVLNKPLLKPHASGDYVTNGINIHSAIFIGGPAVVYGVGERPTPVLPPKIDDLQMINRYGWRGFFKFQMFRPEYIEVHEVAGSTD